MSKNHRHQQYGRRRSKHAALWEERAPRAPKPRMALVEVVPMNRFRPGLVVWAHVPFIDGDGEKTRPAVVMSVTGRTIELLPITTKPTWRLWSQQYVEVEDLVAAGLDKPSAVRLSPVTVDRLDVLNVVGQLEDRDLQSVLARHELTLAV